MTYNFHVKSSTGELIAVLGEGGLKRAIDDGLLQEGDKITVEEIA